MEGLIVVESSPRTLALRILAGLLAAVVGGSVVGSQVLESRSVPMPAATEPANPVAMTDAVTATPTPRVIAVPDATAAAPRDVLTPVPIPTLVTLPTKAATPAPPAVVTPGPMPTPTPAVIVTAVLSEAQPPTSVPAPTATAAPAPTIAAVVSAPIETPSATVLAAAAPSRAFQLEFAADAWVGGFYRGDGLAYGRPWSAVYGAFSAYPRAALSFDLDTTPDAETYFRVTGLDDEWATLNDIVLEVNGQAVYSGAAPFANWDGLGDGANAAWTTVQFTIPAGILRAGSNHIAVANLSQSGNFNMPPYVLLSDATLRSAPLDSVLPVSQPVEAYADPAPQKGKVKKTKEPKVKGPKKDRKNRNRKPGKKK